MRQFLIIALLVIILPSVLAITTTTYTANGTYTVPTGATTLYVETWGGGGGAAGLNSLIDRGGGGGGGGAYAAQIITTTPSTNYTVVIGWGGTGTSSGSGNDGGNTTFSLNGTIYVKAEGGKKWDFSSAPPAPGPGGNGGSADNSIGTVKYSGGNGGWYLPAGGYGSSGGGGAAGSTGPGGAGGNGTIGAAGSAGTGTNENGGNGGTGRLTIGNGNAASIYGGGGGGAKCDGGACGATTGGSGAQGIARITAFNSSAILIFIYDENTQDIIGGTNFTINIASETYFTGTTTINGFAGLESLPNGNYSITISGGSYLQRQYIAEIHSENTTIINAYMTPSTTTTLMVIKAANGPNSGAQVENAIVTFETIINGTYTIVDNRYTDISGTAGPFAYSNTGIYRVSVNHTDYIFKQFVLNPVQYSSYDVLLYSNVGVDYDADFSNVRVGITPTNFVNEQNTIITFSISSPTGALLTYEVNTTYPGGSNYNNGSTIYGQAFLINVTPNGTNYLDWLRINFTYTTDLGTKNFVREYPIIQPPDPNTFKDNEGKDYGMGDFEKALVAIGVTGMLAGLAFLYAGPIGGGLVALVFLSFFVRVGFINEYAAAVSILVGLAITFWRSSQ